MARFSRVPQDPDIDANSAGLADIDPIAAVVHDTIGVYSGPDSGDSQYIEDHGLAHFSIGEDEGEWEQLIDTEKFAAHANGANRKAFGVEFSRLQAGQPLTAWQKRAWKVLREEAEKYHGIPDTYLDPTTVPDASVWVNGGNFRGWISHTSVKTDDGSAQHTDWVPAADFISGDDEVTPEQMAELGKWMQEQSALVTKHIEDTLAGWENDTRAFVKKQVDAAKAEILAAVKGQ